GSDKNLEAVFTRIAGPSKRELDTIIGDFHVAEGGDRVDLVANELNHKRRSIRSLQRQQGSFVGYVAERHTVKTSRILLQPVPVFFNIRRVYDHEIVFGPSVYDQVVDSTAVGHHQLGIQRLVRGGQSVEVIGDHVLNEVMGAVASNHKLTHVRDIEESDL